MGKHVKILSKGRLWGCHLLILVVLGTHELPFLRLLNDVEQLKATGAIEEDVFVQKGHTPFESAHMTVKDFVSYDEMSELYDQASLIITHGGTGSIVTGLKKGKRVIAVARLLKYGEHNDDHQQEIIDEFVKAGYLLEWEEGTPLIGVIERAQNFDPQPFVAGREKILNLLRDFIDRA